MFFSDFIFDWLRSILIITGYVSGNTAFPRPLTPDEEKRFLEEYKNGSVKAKNTLIEHNMRLVAHIVKKYSDEKNLEDLISIGTIGLIKGINTFDSDKNHKLSSYISRCIENEVLMYLRSSKKLQNEISIEESVGTDKEGNNMTFLDILTADNCDICDEISAKLESSKLYDAINKYLTPAETQIIIKRYGLRNTKRLTQKEIAQEMGISRSYVSRIEKRCLKKLAKAFEE